MKHFIPLLFLFLVGCKEKFPHVPSNVIPMDKMEKILVDMHISDAVASNRAMGDLNEKKYSGQYYEQIFKNYEITREDFIKSYNFYENNPILLNKVYDDVLGDISKREANSTK